MEPGPPSDNDGSRRSWGRQLMTLGNVGMMFPVSIALGFLGGWWIDGKLGTRPWLSLLGFALGVGAALRNLIRSVRDLERQEQEERGVDKKSTERDAP